MATTTTCSLTHVERLMSPSVPRWLNPFDVEEVDASASSCQVARKSLLSIDVSNETWENLDQHRLCVVSSILLKLQGLTRDLRPEPEPSQ